MHLQATLKKESLRVLLSLLCFLTLVGSHAIASDSQNEKNILLNSYFGDFRNARIQKKSATIKLEVWQPWIQYVRQNFPPQFQSALLNGPENLTVSFDEIWEAENDENLTESEKRQYKGQLDILKLYWKEGKVQASTVEKFYTENPLTGANLSTPAHKITDIHDRVFILKKLREN